MYGLRIRLAVLFSGVTWLIVFSSVLFSGWTAFSWGCRIFVLAYFLHLLTLADDRSVAAGDGAELFLSRFLLVQVFLCLLLLSGLAIKLPWSVCFMIILLLAQLLVSVVVLHAFNRSSLEEVRRKAASLERETHRLTCLKEVGRAATDAAGDEGAFVGMILDMSLGMLECDAMAACLEGEGEDVLFVSASRDGCSLPSSSAEFLALSSVKRVVGEGARLSHPEGADGWEEGGGDLCAMVGASSCLMCPLVTRERGRGILVALRGEEEPPFGERDRELSLVLSSQIAIALDNAVLYMRMRESYKNTIQALAAAIEAKDSYTHGHSSAVRRYAVLVGRELGMDARRLEMLEYAAILHDIGKIAVSELILNKHGPLTDEEYEMIKLHPVVGAEIIDNVSFLKEAVLYVKHHHEKWDGTGYPDGLAGDEIPLGAQIIGIVDAFDAMTSNRAYRRAMDDGKAVEEIRRAAGTQFSPRVVEAFLRVYESGRIRREMERMYGRLETVAEHLEGDAS